MKHLLVFCLSIFALACSPDAERTRLPAPSGANVDVVDGLMAAFNQHDADKMRAYWHNDVKWFEVSGDQVSVVTTSSQQLHDELVVYFESYPNVQSSLENVAVNGNYITAVERPVWEENGERKSQTSIVVYEIIDGRVKRFWYFPPQ